MTNQNPSFHMKLAYSVVNRLLQRNPELYPIQEDLEGEAMVELCEVCKNFDPSKCNNQGFSTYAVHMIHNKLLKYIVRNEYRFNKLYKLEDMMTPESDSLETPLHWEEIIEGSVIDISKILSEMPSDLREFFYITQHNNVVESRKILGIGSTQFYAKKQRLKEYLEDSVIS